MELISDHYLVVTDLEKRLQRMTNKININKGENSYKKKVAYYKIAQHREAKKSDNNFFGNKNVSNKSNRRGAINRGMKD